MNKDFLFRALSVFMLAGTLSSNIPVLAKISDQLETDSFLPSKQKCDRLIERYEKWASKHPFLASTTACFTGAVVTLGVGFGVLYLKSFLDPECLQVGITSQTSDTSTETTAPYTADSNPFIPMDGFFAEFQPLSKKEALHFCGGSDSFVLDSIEHMILPRSFNN